MVLALTPPVHDDLKMDAQASAFNGLFSAGVDMVAVVNRGEARLVVPPRRGPRPRFSRRSGGVSGLRVAARIAPGVISAPRRRSSH